MRVLLVEDDAFFVKVIARYLSTQGHEVRVVDRSDEAIRVLEGPRFDFVLVDQGLADGQLGVRVIEHLRATNPTVPRCLMSGGGNVGPSSVQGPYEIFHSKPITPPLLESLLDWARKG